MKGLAFGISLLFIFAGIASASITISSPTIPIGSTQTLTATALGGVSPYSFNFLVYNPSGALTFNQIAPGNGVSTTNPEIYSYVQSSPTGIWSVNIIITDSTGNTMILDPTYNVTPGSIFKIEQTHSIIGVGQTGIGGTPPYTYKWFEATPPSCATYNSIPNGIGPSNFSNTIEYYFNTTQSTSIGIYCFIEQITDNSGSIANSMATGVNVTSIIGPNIGQRSTPPISSFPNVPIGIGLAICSIEIFLFSFIALSRKEDGIVYLIVFRLLAFLLMFIAYSILISPQTITYPTYNAVSGSTIATFQSFNSIGTTSLGTQRIVGWIILVYIVVIIGSLGIDVVFGLREKKK